MIFLGGTFEGPKWREELIPLLKAKGLEYFDPVVENWDSAAKANEERQKTKATTILYLIQQTTSLYSLVEAAISSCISSAVVVVCFLYPNNIVAKRRRQLHDIGILLERYGAIAVESMRYEYDVEALADILEEAEKDID